MQIMTSHPLLPSMLAVAIALGGLLATPAAHALSDDEARRAIIELRGQVQQLRTQNQRAQLQLSDRLDLMTQEIATLRGRIEELGRPAGTAAGPAADSRTAQINDPQQRSAYEAAAGQYRNGQYREAASGFDAFVKAYPDSPLAGTALFFLGSSQYATKDFKSSIQTLNTLVKDHPDDDRAPDALLVIAADQIELNDLEAAKASLQRIIKTYPGSSAAETAASRLKLL